MSKKNGIDGVGIVITLFAMLFSTVSWCCDQVIPLAVVGTGEAEACEVVRTYEVPVYDDTLDGGLGECTMTEVWVTK